MKNLFLPFVVVALFAVGSCDDSTINPPVKKITKPIVIKALKSVTIDSLSLLIRLSPYGGNYDTINSVMSRLGFPAIRSEKLNMINSDTGYYFSWDAYEYPSGWYPFVTGVSFTIDSITRQIKNIYFRQSRNYTVISSKTGTQTGAEQSGFSITLGKAAYSIDDTLMTVRLSGKSLQDEITKLEYGIFHQNGGYYYYSYFVSLLPFNDSSIFELQFIIE